MYFSEKYKFVYLAIPKTGSTSIRRILRQKYGATILRDGHDNIIPDKFKNFFTFTCVRNPYHRAVSCYYHIHRKTNEIIPLKECWHKFHMISMCEYLSNLYQLDHFAYPQDDASKYWIGSANIRLDAFIKLESLEEDFSKLPFVNQRIKFPKENTVQKQVLLGSSKFVEIPQKLIEEVPVRYKEDFIRFNYDQVVPSDFRKIPPIML